MQRSLDTDPQGEWIFIVDRLNIHQSESLVRIIASACEIGNELGIKGKAGILKSMPTRRAFLSCEHHRIRFVYNTETHLVVESDRAVVFNLGPPAAQKGIVYFH